VYFIYGMHECLNVVVDREGVPGCVLIRALEPLVGLNTMAERRAGRSNQAPNCRISSLANGPGKLTQALGITREHYGLRLDRGPLTIREWKEKPDFEVEVTPRIGIKESADLPLRFLWRNNRFVSR
jgi:DNA-3-methyladenine glycosylase